MRLTFKVEKWSDVVAEMRALWPLHWEELALDKDIIKHDMDEERYRHMESVDMLHIVTARADGILVGYIICFIVTHFHYKSSGFMALADMYYVLPAYRIGGCGAKLFIFMESSLRERGVVRAHMSCKVHQDHQALFEHLGWEFTDKTFSKVLKED
ncbi:MAG: GNAT family N-acetyltransferase [Candidatus Micrarchaeaceae archaeon]